ncbi:MAG TPA: Flp pilus assembly protein CpaB [Acidobacteriaceae bacterium]|nr:Flp pilus assembly protein CpaB [Acidobacteriaceae bacterium]
MARRMMLALVVALVISGLFTFWLSRRVAHASRTVVQPPNQYVAAARALDPGEILRREDVNMINWPKDHPLDGSFVKVDDVVGRAVLYALSPGQPIVDRQLAPKGSGLGLTGRIPSGMRAIALRSDEVVGVAGFLMPGTHVDVIVTYTDQEHPQPVTATVLQDVEVLAAGHQVQPDPSGKPISVDVVTLLLAPEAAEKATLASEKGTIHFVLRNGGDHKQSSAPPVNLAQLANLPTTKPEQGEPRPRAASHPAPKPWVVETMMGDKRSTASFY